MSTVATSSCPRGGQQEQPAPLHEGRDGVDVRRDAGHQGAAALGVLGQRRQVVDVPEGPGPQRRQARLGGPEDPPVGEEGRDGGDDQPARGGRAEDQHEAGARAVRPADPPVDGLLHGDGHDDPADRGDERDQQGQARGRG